MANERAILCGDVRDENLPVEERKALRLSLKHSPMDPFGNITLEIESIRGRMLRDLPSAFHDLVEIATYVYCADQAISRGGDGVEDVGANWRRRLHFRIAVRNPEFWSQSAILGPLTETLSFLSEDEYFFDFRPLTSEPPKQYFLEFADEKDLVGDPEEVMLFSGGLDSLAGAVQEAVIDHRPVALVTHKSTNKLAKRHRQLRQMLAERAGDTPPIHFPVTIHKSKSMNREYTQRSRSFLYASLAATVASMYGLSRIKFYENGVISLNLPPSPQVVGARATRTTHPRVIQGFRTLFSAIAGKDFQVETPFLWKTKAEVLDVIKHAGCQDPESVIWFWG